MVLRSTQWVETLLKTAKADSKTIFRVTPTFTAVLPDTTYRIWLQTIDCKIRVSYRLTLANLEPTAVYVYISEPNSVYGRIPKTNPDLGAQFRPQIWIFAF